VIQDTDGATSEPSRRRHVATVSASVAAAALLLLYVLLVPTPRMLVGVCTGAAASSCGETVFTSDPTWTLGGQSLRDDVTSTECAAGVGSSPPVHLLFDRSGQLMAAYTSGKTGRFIPLPQAYVGSGWLTVPCDTSDVFAPRLNRAR
jgi:hypothetical protein